MASASSWLRAAFAQALVGLLLAALTASGRAPWDDEAHAIALAVALSFAAASLALGLARPFLRYETEIPLLAQAAWLAAFAGDVILASGFSRVGAALEGVALLAIVAHAPLALTRARYAGDRLFGPEQPFRMGDSVVAACFALGAAGLATGAALLLAPPRANGASALILVVAAGALPLLLGALAFLAPRVARAPLSGATLLAGSLVVGGLGSAFLALAHAFPFTFETRYPATALALGILLALVALLRLRAPEGALKPLLRGAAAAAILAVLAIALAYPLGGYALAPVALYALMLLAATLAWAGALAAGPLLFGGEPRPGRWAAWSVGLAIASLFLVAPAFQYPRSAFPGVAVALVALLLAAWGLAPLASSVKRKLPRR